MGEHNEKMNHQTLELSKKAMRRNVSSVRNVFPASGSSSCCTHILQSQSHSVGSQSHAVMKSTGQSSPDKSTSCLPPGCRCRTPLPSLAQHQQALSSKTTNLKPDNSGLVENMLSETMAQNAMQDKDETESIEEGEFIPDKSPDASIKSSMIAHDVIWCGNDKCSVLQGQSPPDASKRNMKNMTRDSLSQKCFLTRRDFPPECGSRGPRLCPTEYEDELLCYKATGFKKDTPSLQDIRLLEDLEAAEFIPEMSPGSSIKSSASAQVFKWRRNNDQDDFQGVGAKEAGSPSPVKFQTSSKGMLKKACLREENILYHHRDDWNREVQDIIKETKKSVRCPPGASPIMKDKGCKRKSIDRRNIMNSLEESTLNSSESLLVAPRSDIGRSTSSSMLKNANVMRDDMHKLARKRMIKALRLYRDIFDELSLEKSKASKKSSCIRRIDFHAAKEVKKIAGYVHGAMQFIGNVPGVQVGDKFHYRMELAVVGLHRPPQNGIDYMGSHSDVLATSVVASWDYTDNLSKPDELIYLGQGGMPGRDKKAEDQKLTRGNLALVNSMKRNKPVRVIRKNRDHTFTYDGLYVVDSCRKLPRENGQMVFEFLMKRLPSQPEIGQKKKIKVTRRDGKS